MQEVKTYSTDDLTEFTIKLLSLEKINFSLVLKCYDTIDWETSFDGSYYYIILTP